MTTTPTSKITIADLVLGVTCHANHHAGQVQLVRALGAARADDAAFVVEGSARTMNAIIRFPSREAALGLYQDPDYQEAKRIRHRSTSNCTMVLVEEAAPTRPAP